MPTIPQGINSRQGPEDSTDEDTLLRAEADLANETEEFNEVLQVIKSASQGVSTGTYKEYDRCALLRRARLSLTSF